MENQQTILIEKTNKSIKAKLAISKFVIFIGLFMAVFADADSTKVWGCLITLSALIGFKFAQTLRWWHHD